MKVKRTYKYRLFRCNRKDKQLHSTIDTASEIYNHALELAQRYYSLYGKTLSFGKLKSHIAKLRRERPKYKHWQIVGSQAVQDIVERIERGYQKFFRKENQSPPQHRSMYKYKSFTLKQHGAGYKLLDDNKIKIGSKIYRYVKHRLFGGDIKTLTVKRDSLGRLWLFFVVEEELLISHEFTTGKIEGFDFGLGTFLVDSEGQEYHNPRYYEASLNRVKSLQSSRDRKQKGSTNRLKTKNLLTREHIRIEDRRRDYHFKLAHELCDKYDVLCFETLDIEAMKQYPFWGRKVSDLAFAQFLNVVKWVAQKRGVEVLQIDQWTATTQTCSNCYHKQKLSLEDRIFNCENCGLELPRDHNAAKNIQRIGASMHTGSVQEQLVPV